jgi:hypothetical protein
MYDFGLYFSVCQCASEPPNTLGLADFATRHTRQSTPQFHTHAPRLRLRVTHRGLRTRRVPRAGQRDRHTGTQGSGRRPCRRKRQSDSHTAHVSSRHSVSLTTRTARHGKHGHALLLSLRSTSHTPAQAQAVSSTAVCTHHTHRTESNAVRSILSSPVHAHGHHLLLARGAPFQMFSHSTLLTFARRPLAEAHSPPPARVANCAPATTESECQTDRTGLHRAQS